MLDDTHKERYKEGREITPHQKRKKEKNESKEDISNPSGLQNKDGESQPRLSQQH